MTTFRDLALSYRANLLRQDIMTKAQWSGAGMLIAFMLAACGSEMPAQQASGTHRLAGDDVAIYNIAGTVALTAGSQREVIVSVTTAGPDAARLGVATGPVRGRESLRILYPDDDVVYAPLGEHSNSTVRVADDGTFYDGNQRGAHTVRIRGGGPGLEASANLGIAVPAGAKVAIYLAVGNVTVRNVEGELHLDTGSAEVDVDGVRGPLSLDTGSSSVTVNNVRGSDLSIDSGSGDVTGARLSVSRLVLDTGSGSVTLNEVSADRVELDTGSGDVMLDLLTDMRDLAIDSGSGNVTIRAPQGLSGRLTAETGSGEFEIDFPIELTSREDGEIRGTIGNGNGRINIETGSGDVRILAR